MRDALPVAQTYAAPQPDRSALVAAATLLRLASDQRLVEHARAGSEAAFEALFRRYRQPLLAYCQRMLGSEAEAEDAVQQTFLAAYLTLGRLEHPVAFRAWLYGIARHRCLSVLRMRGDRPVEPAPESTSDRLVADVVARDDLRAVLTDLTELPDEQRAAIVLAELGGVPHDQIARILGCRHDKVKALVFQARASLTATRAARETPCAEIQQQLIALRGGALRRTTLRRHLSGCATCREFREQLSARRRGSRMLLPALALKRGILGPLFGGAGETTLTAGAVGTRGLAATALTALVIHGGGLVAAIAPSREGASAAEAVRSSDWTAAPTGEGATLPPVLRWRVGPIGTAPRPSGREVTASTPVADRAQAGRRPPSADPTTQTKGAVAPETTDDTDRPAGADQAAAPSDNGAAPAVSAADQATTGSGHGKADPADQPAAANASEHAPAGAAKPATPPATPAAQGNDAPAAPGHRITPPAPDRGVAPPRATPTTAPAPSTSAPSPVTDPAPSGSGLRSGHRD
jgi:RNA polymerase sigma factor (sigma-70 family)